MTHLTPREVRVLQADLIADVMSLVDTHERESNRKQRLHEEAEMLSLLLLLVIGMICLATSFAGPASDILVSIPNAGVLIYRRLHRR